MWFSSIDLQHGSKRAILKINLSSKLRKVVSNGLNMGLTYVNSSYTNVLDSTKFLHEKRGQAPHDWFGKPTWPPSHCFVYTNMAIVTSCKNFLHTNTLTVTGLVCQTCRASCFSFLCVWKSKKSTLLRVNSSANPCFLESKSWWLVSN